MVCVKLKYVKISIFNKFNIALTPKCIIWIWFGQSFLTDDVKTWVKYILKIFPIHNPNTSKKYLEYVSE